MGGGFLLVVEDTVYGIGLAAGVSARPDVDDGAGILSKFYGGFVLGVNEGFGNIVVLFVDIRLGYMGMPDEKSVNALYL